MVIEKTEITPLLTSRSCTSALPCQSTSSADSISSLTPPLPLPRKALKYLPPFESNVLYRLEELVRLVLDFRCESTEGDGFSTLNWAKDVDEQLNLNL